MSNHMSRYDLTRWSGLAGLASGLLIIVGAVSLLAGQPLISGALFLTGHILLFFLLTGVYSTTFTRTGVLGFIGYVLSTIGNALFIVMQAIGSFVLPGEEISVDFYPSAVLATGILFSIGLLLFALANSRVRALSAWAGWLIFAGVALNVILHRLSVEMPDPVSIVPPILTGLGVFGFGWALRWN